MDMCWYTRAHLQGLYSSMKWPGAEEAMCTWTRALPPPPSYCAPGFKNQFISHDKVQEAGEINITLLSEETGDHTSGQEAGERSFLGAAALPLRQQRGRSYERSPRATWTVHRSQERPFPLTFQATAASPSTCNRLLGSPYRGRAQP